ncbi:MAG: coiled-coil domain-containing protein [Sulfuriferula sp.]
MSLIARIQFVNFLTYSNPDSQDRKPAMRVVEFSPLKYSTAINIPNGHGKTNMISVLLYLLSRDRKLKETALPLFTPRRCGAPSHIRVQLWDLQDDLTQNDLNLDEGLMDPRDLPITNRDHHVFGLCAYQNDEPKFYYYRGILDDCPVYDRTESGYIYHKESEVQQAVKSIDGTWNISSVDEWRTLVTSHIPSRVLTQQVKFHLAGGGDKSAQLHQIEPDDDETFGQAFFRSIIAPEILAPTSEIENDPNDPRENFEELLYAHFSAMASATVKAEQEREIIKEQEEVVKVLGGLVAAGEKAKQGHDEYQGLIAGIARDGAMVKHLVRTDPLPGLLDGRSLPPGRAGEIVPYIVIDKHYGSMILDAGLEKLTNVDPSNLNRAAERRHIQKCEIDESQIIEYAWNLDLKASPKGGGYSRKGYTLNAALELVPHLKEIGTAKVAGAEDTLNQAFGWVDSVGDTNIYRKEVRQLTAEIDRLHNAIKGREAEITQWEKEARTIADLITKYDQAKGAYEDLLKSGHFTAEELNAPALLVGRVAQELREAEDALTAHNLRVGSLEKTFGSYMRFCQSNPGVTARARLEELTTKNANANDALRDAEQRQKHLTGELQRLTSQKISQENQNRSDQKQLDTLFALQSHQTTYVEWFGDAAPESINISENLKKIATDEAALGQRRRERESLRDTITELLPSIPRYQQLFGEEEAKRIDISGELQKIATMELTLGREQKMVETLHGRVSQLKPFVKLFNDIFADADPAQLDPTKERADLQHAITLATSTVETLEAHVSRLKLFRATHAGITAAEWLNTMETQRSALTLEIAQFDHQIQTAKRQLAELMNDPVARPEEIASAHALIDGVVSFTPLHSFIEEHCPGAVKQHWLTHFSALLFSPVVDTPEEAAKAAHLLYDGQAMIPVLIADRLKATMESDTPTMALADDCAYTWLAGVKTRMVHCLMNPAAVEEERELAKARLDEFRSSREVKQEALNQLSDKTEAVMLARDADRAEDTNAEDSLATNAKALAKLQEQLPEIVKRCSNDALESISRVREYKALLNKHGEDVFDRLVIELNQIEEKANSLRESRSWYEDRNTDEVRNVVTAMRRYQDLLLEHGDNVHQMVLDDLKHIAEEADDLRRSREWNEARNIDSVRFAIDAMRRYNQAGGETEVARLRTVVEAGIASLESILTKLAVTTEAAAQAEAHLSASQSTASDAALAYNQNKQYLESLVSFAECDDLPFMEAHLEHRNTLDGKKRKADIRKSYESQFGHAQRYRKEQGDNTSEQSLLDQKAALESMVATSKQSQVQDTESIEDKRGRCTALTPFRDTLHEAAASVLAEFRAVSKSLDEIGAVMSGEASRFENADLYQLAESIRTRLERADSDPFLLDEIRKIRRFAGDLGLAAQSKDIARAKRESGQLNSRYQERKAQFCAEIINGTIKGLSVLNAEWLQSQDGFSAPLEMKTQIEKNIESKREVLQQATTTLDDVRDKTTKVLSTLAKDSDRALQILDEAMCSTPSARFYVKANVISEDKVNSLMARLYGEIEAKRRAHSDNGTAAQKRQKKSDLEYLRSEIYRSLFADVTVEFSHPSIWNGDRSPLTATGLSEGMRTAVSLMWIAKLAEFRLRQAIDQAGGMKRQNRAALRKERYFMILDGLFSNLSHDDMIDSAMESLRLSAGHFQLIGMIHHPRYINNPKIFRSYFVGRPYRSSNGKHAWLTVDPKNNVPGSLGVLGSYLTNQDNPNAQ